VATASYRPSVRIFSEAAVTGIADGAERVDPAAPAALPRGFNGKRGAARAGDEIIAVLDLAARIPRRKCVLAHTALIATHRLWECGFRSGHHDWLRPVEDRRCAAWTSAETVHDANREAARCCQWFRSKERKGAMTIRRLTTCAITLGLVCAGSVPVRAQANLPLPTPRSHYETFTPGLSGLPLFQTLTKDLDPQTHKTLLTVVTSSRVPAGRATVVPKGQAVARLKELNWRPWKPLLLEFVVHQSEVFEIIPERFRTFIYPIVHDSLLYFLDHLPEDRLLEKLVDVADLGPGSTRSAELTAFVAKTPSLQKLGQILARNQALSPEYREALQQLENGIHTMTRDELTQFIAADIGENNIAANHVEFADALSG
jgi:hypothetical protein